MDLEQALIRLQCAYPRVYLACHACHQHAKSTAVQLSQRDSTILAHLDERAPFGQGDLARYLGVAKSTLSAAIDSLAGLGYVERVKLGRSNSLLRTPRGTRAMSGSSGIESARLRKHLRKLSAADLARTVEGLEILAQR